MSEPMGAPAPDAKTMSDIQQQATSALHDAGEAASSLYDEAKDKVEESVTAEARVAADRVDDVAGALRGSAEHLADNEQWLARLMTKGADELGGMASTLRTNDLRALLGQVEDFARRQPSLFTGAAVAAGFVAARVARQSIRVESANAKPASPPAYPAADSGQSVNI